MHVTQTFYLNMLYVKVSLDIFLKRKCINPWSAMSCLIFLKSSNASKLKWRLK